MPVLHVLVTVWAFFIRGHCPATLTVRNHVRILPKAAFGVGSGSLLASVKGARERRRAERRPAVSEGHRAGRCTAAGRDRAHRRREGDKLTEGPGHSVRG